MEEQELESQIEDLAIQLCNNEKRSIWSVFTPQEFKLHMAKQIINYSALKLGSLLPEKQAENEVSLLTEQIFEQIDKVLKTHVQHDKDLQDRNFVRFLQTFKKCLIYMSETDCYYREWLRLYYLLTYFTVQANLNKIATIKKIEMK